MTRPYVRGTISVTGAPLLFSKGWNSLEKTMT